MGFTRIPRTDAKPTSCNATQRCSLETLVQVADTRGCIESSFEAAKQEAGLDEHEVRSTAGWYRHITLALLRATTLPNAAPRWCPYKKARRQPGNLQTVPRAGVGLSRAGDGCCGCASCPAPATSWPGPGWTGSDTTAGRPSAATIDDASSLPVYNCIRA